MVNMRGSRSCHAACLAAALVLGCGNNWESYAPVQTNAGAGASSSSSSSSTTTTTGTGATDNCGFYDAFSATFDDSSLPAGFEATVDSEEKGTAAFEKGRLFLGRANTFSNSDWSAKITQRHRYSLLGQRITIEVAEIDADTTVYFGVANPSSSTPLFAVVRNSNRDMTISTTGTNETLVACSVNYNSDDHRWWAIDVPAAGTTDGTIQAWTSPDGSQWSLLCDYPAAWLPTLDRVQVVIGASGSGGFDDGAEVDNFNAAPGQASQGKLCPTSSLRDDFNDGILARHWLPELYNRHHESNGVMHLFMREDASTNPVQLESDRAYDMAKDGAAVQVEVLRVANDKVHTQLHLGGLDGGAAILGVYEGKLRFESTSDNSTSEMTLHKLGSYEPAQHRWWRLERADGRLIASTSADGLAFEEFGSVDVPAFLDRVVLSLRGLQPTGTVPDEEVGERWATFDNFNAFDINDEANR